MPAWHVSHSPQSPQSMETPQLFGRGRHWGYGFPGRGPHVTETGSGTQVPLQGYPGCGIYAPSLRINFTAEAGTFISVYLPNFPGTQILTSCGAASAPAARPPATAAVPRPSPLRKRLRDEPDANERTMSSKRSPSIGCPSLFRRFPGKAPLAFFSWRPQYESEDSFFQAFL